MTAARIDTAKQYLRRKKTADQLRQMADELFELATEDVTITSQGFEGGTASGQMTFPKIELLQAIEELILEKDPTNTTPPPSRTRHLDFSRRYIGT